VLDELVAQRLVENVAEQLEQTLEHAEELLVHLVEALAETGQHGLENELVLLLVLDQVPAVALQPDERLDAGVARLFDGRLHALDAGEEQRDDGEPQREGRVAAVGRLHLGQQEEGLEHQHLQEEQQRARDQFGPVQDHQVDVACQLKG